MESPCTQRETGCLIINMIRVPSFTLLNWCQYNEFRSDEETMESMTKHKWYSQSVP